MTIRCDGRHRAHSHAPLSLRFEISVRLFRRSQPTTSPAARGQKTRTPPPYWPARGAMFSVLGARLDPNTRNCRCGPRACMVALVCCGCGVATRVLNTSRPPRRASTSLLLAWRRRTK
eukprot:2071669-Prymnesium_polylepis.1